MRILLINNDGGGFADHVEIAEGTTVLQLFQKHLADASTRRLSDSRQPPAGRTR